MIIKTVKYLQEAIDIFKSRVEDLWPRFVMVHGVVSVGQKLETCRPAVHRNASRCCCVLLGFEGVDPGFCPHGWLLSILIYVLKDHIRFLRCLNLYYVVTIYIGVYVSVFYFRFGNFLSRFSVKNSIFHQTVSVIAVCLVTEAV